jgi:hypothetical protein
MPARSKAQQQAMAIAEHTPSKLYARNRGLTKMSHTQLHDFAATKTGKLPEKVKRSAKGSGPFSLGNLGAGFKMPSSQVKIPGFKGGMGRTPGFNTPGITGRLRPRAAFSNPKLGGFGSPGSRYGSGPMEHPDMKQGYKNMGKCGKWAGK